jgi:GntR family transcriptional regulator
MFIKDGARNLLLDAERQRFLKDEWPRIAANIHRLGLKREDLLKSVQSKSKKEDD